MDYGNRKPRILFIEDDLSLSNLYTLRMRAEGWEVLPANDSDKALQAAKEFKPDLILTDLMMPNLNGFDVIDILRNTMETSASKIIVMSALSNPEDIEKASQLGADDYIVKSFVTLDEVIARIAAQLKPAQDSFAA